MQRSERGGDRLADGVSSGDSTLAHADESARASLRAGSRVSGERGENGERNAPSGGGWRGCRKDSGAETFGRCDSSWVSDPTAICEHVRWLSSTAHARARVNELTTLTDSRLTAFRFGVETLVVPQHRGLACANDHPELIKLDINIESNNCNLVKPEFERSTHVSLGSQQLSRFTRHFC